MRLRSKLITLALFLLGPSFVFNPAYAQVSATQSVSGIYYHVDGNTSRSFYPANEADYLYEGGI